MRRLYKDIGLAASAPMAVLIRGQTGTGKELVAHAIHRHSERAREPFVAVNCTAIPEPLLESELFGHERGAFTGAYARHTGRFEQARQGTIFLDEIGDLNLATQAKLLRVLQEKSFQRVGGTERVSLAARILAATHQGLEAAMRHGQFRQDLFYRLSALTITVPALDARRDDIPLLARHFLRRAEREMGLSGSVMEAEAIEFLQKQAWPGNVRQLEHVIEHALLLARANPVMLAHVQEAYSSSRGPVEPEPETFDHYFSQLLARAETVQDAHDRMIKDMERELFTRAITLAQGNQAKAARWLGVTRTTMREKLIHFGLHAPHEEPKDTDGKPDESAES